MSNLRVNIARWFAEIAYKGLSANAVNQTLHQELSDTREIAFARECLFGSARHFEKLNWIAQQLLKRPLKAREKELKGLLITALYQLLYLDTPDHAVLSESVEATRILQREWASGLINGVLRSALREKQSLLNNDKQPDWVKHEVPEWLLKRLKNAWPKNWQQICSESNRKAPLILRANQQFSLDESANLLEQANIDYRSIDNFPTAFVLKEARPIQEIPEFSTGRFSVQDSAAQLAADLLPIQPGDCVLDACAAPGGKTAHILEKHKDIHLTAIELDEKRAQKIHENLNRLGLNCKVEIVDAASFIEPEKYDAILLDAPCSATGVIRRQPDIKLHRTDEDIYPTVQLQQNILTNLWDNLKPDGYFLYATCSILPDENHKQIKRFLKQFHDAELVSLEIPTSIHHMKTPFGMQLLPAQDNDGFFYSLLRKTKSN
ncbi:16S rRNA (cytosine(967)-C(5))-methyltransferase RsmB [Pleionea sediminis]|uniref:16S rRNA (cytosine(967)-C(5))-methyltransferase RsmB n=1 Tax=Pleionea sediminis TaxID=2569479 RepID=UPI001185E6D4|nr:16S rRNA (cytosine(967)-C(5))-methyltransferase RsmB [Pleionea sediminis]